MESNIVHEGGLCISCREFIRQQPLKKVEGLPLPTSPRPKGETPKTPKKAYKEKLLKLSAMLIVLDPPIPSLALEIR